NFTIDDHKIIVTTLYAFYEEGQTPNVGLFLQRNKDERIRSLTAEIAMVPSVLMDHEEGLMDYISVIKKQFSDVSIIDEYRETQRIAEQANDALKAAQIGMKIFEVQKQIKQSN